jgi:hypothetical protein
MWALATALFFLQLGVWYLVCAFLIANLNSPGWIAGMAIAIPIIIALIAWHVGSGLLDRGGDNPLSDARKKIVYKRLSIVFAAIFVIAHLAVSLSVRQLNAKSELLLAEVLSKSEAQRLVRYAENHGNAYPNSLSAEGEYSPGLDLAQFEYFGEGMTLSFPPQPVVVLASRNTYHNGKRLLCTEDGRVLWVTETSYKSLHDQLEKHKPISESADDRDSSSPG